MSENAIEVRDLVKRYGETEAVRGVSFSVRRGGVVGFLGPNGAGKTTTMRMLACFTEPSGGTATVAGHDVVANPLDVRRRLGYLPESAPLYAESLAIEHLRFIAEVHGAAVNDIRLAAERCGVTAVLERPIGELSKGFRQRVGLAAATLHRPDILILDEPTSGLDPNQVVEIRNLIKEIGKEKTVLLSTHILREVEATCDRVLIIHAGRIVADESLDKLRSGRGVTARVRGPAKEVETALRAIAGAGSIHATDIGGGCCRVRLDTEGGASACEAVFEALRGRPWPVSELRAEEASLEEVFHRLTEGE